MILLRRNVILNVCPEIDETIRILEREHDEIGKDFIILSANDGQHSPGSLHQSGKAIDIKTPYFNKREIFNLIRHMGFKSKDIIKYSWGFHIEFDVEWISLHSIYNLLNAIMTKVSAIFSKTFKKEVK